MAGRATESDAAEQPRASSPPRPGALDLLADQFDQLHSLVYRYVLHRFFDPELAEELTAETFYKAVGGVRRIDGDIRRVRVWLLRIATNIANTHYRRKRLRQLFLRQAATKATTTDTESASDEADGRRSARVRAVLLALRPKYQTVVVLRYYAQMSFSDIAAVVGCRQDAVRARLSRAIKEMRQRLGDQGLIEQTDTQPAR